MAYTAINDPSLYFQTVLYTGNGGTQDITLPGDTDLQPDLIWTKGRNIAAGSILTDSVRGVNRQLQAASNALEETLTTVHTAFNSDGFSLGSNGNVNTDGNTYVGWCWKETATAGFDIVTATGNATAKTISHSLSAVPHVMISKEKSGSVNDWTVYHHKNTSAPETDSLILNETNATSDQNTHWNDTSPTSSVFTVGTGSVVNRDSSTYVYYLWSEKQGYSKFGKYTGNGNADGPFVYTGFRPAFVITKRTDSSTNGHWSIFDTKRNTHNVNDLPLRANVTDAQSSIGNYAFDILSNGFKPRGTNTTNDSGGTFIYIAFAEAPFVNSNGVPCNAR